MKIHRNHALRLCAGVLSLTLSLLNYSSQSQPNAGQAGGSAISALKAKKVCVAVFASGDGGAAGEKTAQARLENILMDNGITALDQSKADELKKNWRNLIKTDYVITDEDWAKYAKQYEISAIFRVYISADVAPGLADYFSGTAKADVRVVMANAQVQSVTSAPMGTKGNPPCDGITSDAALRCAVQVALEDACSKLGCKFIPTPVDRVTLVLTGPVSTPAGEEKEAGRVAETTVQGMLSLNNATWAKEHLSCAAKSPDGNMAAAGGYVEDIDFHRRPPMIRGAKMHLVDLTSKRELPSLECYAIEKKEMSEKGDRIMSDCIFLGNWRYLAAVSGSDLFLWDTDLTKLAKQRFDREMKNAKLSFIRASDGGYLVVKSSKSSLAYKIDRKQ